MRYGFDFIELGGTPNDEDCTQIEDLDHEKWNKVECRVYINQLKRLFPEQCKLTTLDLIRNIHDFGIYYEVGAPYREGNEEQEDAVYEIEGNLPNNWDEESIKELEIRKHPSY